MPDEKICENSETKDIKEESIIIAILHLLEVESILKYIYPKTSESLLELSHAILQDFKISEKNLQFYKNLKDKFLNSDSKEEFENE